MNEQISIDYPSLKIMGEDALEFFLEELQQGNTIQISNCPNGKQILIQTKRDWNDALDTLKINTPTTPKKSYRI